MGFCSDPLAGLAFANGTGDLSIVLDWQTQHSVALPASNQGASGAQATQNQKASL
jgi:hypothetical protein